MLDHGAQRSDLSTARAEAAALAHSLRAALDGTVTALGRITADLAGFGRSLTDLIGLLEGPESSGVPEQVRVDFFPDRSVLRAWLDGIAPLNRREPSAMHPDFPGAETLRTSLDVDLALLARGVRYRMLASEAEARRPEVRRYLDALRAAGAQVRVAEAVPLMMMVIDAAIAVVPNRGPEGPGDLVVQSTLIAGRLMEAFEYSWLAAGDYPEASSPSPQLTPLDSRILRMLASGAKDEAIARSLGCSERTVRRHIAATLEVLGASSRFSAGARAARLGLLD
jgi:DNA-binding CsgD family transcriptional regulator